MTTSDEEHEDKFYLPDERLVSRQKEKATWYHWVWCTEHKTVSKQDKNENVINTVIFTRG